MCISLCKRDECTRCTFMYIDVHSSIAYRRVSVHTCTPCVYHMCACMFPTLASVRVSCSCALYIHVRRHIILDTVHVHVDRYMHVHIYIYIYISQICIISAFRSIHVHVPSIFMYASVMMCLLHVCFCVSCSCTLYIHVRRHIILDTLQLLVPNEYVYLHVCFFFFSFATVLGLFCHSSRALLP